MTKEKRYITRGIQNCRFSGYLRVVARFNFCVTWQEITLNPLLDILPTSSNPMTTTLY
jgi:hypothetical protein